MTTSRALLLTLTFITSLSQTARAQTSPGAALATGLLATIGTTATGAMIGAAGECRTACAGLMVTGVLVGPAIGYAGAGLGSRGMGGILTRIGIVGVTGGLMSAICSGGGCTFASGDKSTGPALLVGFVGTFILVAQIARDLSHIPGAVREHRARTAEAVLSLAPIVSVETGSIGLRALVRF